MHTAHLLLLIWVHCPCSLDPIVASFTHTLFMQDGSSHKLHMSSLQAIWYVHASLQLTAVHHAALTGATMHSTSVSLLCCTTSGGMWCMVLYNLTSMAGGTQLLYYDIT